MDNTSWQSALQDMQPSQGGGVMPSAQPGEMGNIPYAPGAMAQYQGPGIPRARDLYNQYPGYDSSGGGIDYSQGAQNQGRYGQPQSPPAQSGYSTGQTRGLLDALQQILRAHLGVAATKGVGRSY
jgi:hypothetical protein